MSPQPDDERTEKIDKLMALTIAGAKGLAPLGQVMLPLAQIAQGQAAPPEIRALAQVLLRILKGERDPLALAESLTPTLAEIVWETLEQIEAPLPEEASLEPVGLTFEELIEKVAEACSGEVLLWQQLWQLTQQLAADASLPPEIQTLGRVLSKILAGERQKFILDELSPSHHWAVEHLLDWLSERATAPESPQS
ncbi:MAG: hypothetical protein U0401_00855 [Anaerolineae bacterium]